MGKNIVNLALCEICGHKGYCTRNTCYLHDISMDMFEDGKDIIEDCKDEDYIFDKVCESCINTGNVNCNHKGDCKCNTIQSFDEAFTYAIDKYPNSVGITDNSYKENKVSMSVLPDSGNRTEFESGAVRDCAVGKGRCDLLPLDIISKLLKWEDELEIFNGIQDFKDCGNPDILYCVLNKFLHDYVCDEPEGVIPDVYTAILEVAKHFEDGATKYGENNWQKGIPVYRYIDSATRHYIKYLRGDIDERHDRAFMWNMICAIWTCKHIPELNTYDE